MKRIVVATHNKAKTEAVDEAVRDHFEASRTREEYTIVPISVESGVSDTPLSDEEGLAGCRNRLVSARALMPEANLYVAMEGILFQVKNAWFIKGWTTIYDKDCDREASAAGASVPVPSKAVELIESTGQFSVDLHRGYELNEDEQVNIRNLGANGVFSGGTYARHDTFYDGVRICLGYIDNERNW